MRVVLEHCDVKGHGAVRGLSPVAASGGCSSLQCVGFSLQWIFLLSLQRHRSPDFISCYLKKSPLPLHEDGIYFNFYSLLF